MIKYRTLNKSIFLNHIATNELVHASINIELKSLKPINLEHLYATDNLSIAIICALRLAFPSNTIRMQIYKIFGKQFIFTSISREQYNDVINKKIKLYYCNKKDFNKHLKIGSKISKYTFNIVKTPGYEYITTNELFPNCEMTITINNIVNHTTHNIKDNTLLITIKAIFSFIIFQKKFLTIINSDKED